MRSEATEMTLIDGKDCNCPTCNSLPSDFAADPVNGVTLCFAASATRAILRGLCLTIL